MGISTYAGNKTLDFWHRGVAMSAPARVWVSLHTADPGNTGLNEATTGAWPAYVRKDPAQAGAVGTGFAAASSESMANAFDLLWPAFDGSGSIVLTHFAIWDALTVGNLITFGPLTAARTLLPTDEFIAKAGSIVVTTT